MAMNFSEEEKKKMLEDDSEIYQKREDGLDANNGELKKLKGRQKREYFRQYYMGTVAVIVVVAILAVLFFKNAVEKKPQCALYIAIEDDVLDEEKVADFEKAVEKAIVLIEARQHKVPENIIIKQEYNNISVTTSDILYIEAMENYTKIFRTSGNYILSRTSLKAIQKMLPKDRFLRTHRSYIESINKIERFSKREITLKGCSATIPIGRQYAENVYSKLTTRSITT